MKSRFLLAALAPLLIGSAAHAGALVDVQIVDRDTGGTLPIYTHRAKQYVAGAPGHRYAVRIVNRTGARVLTVLSVDGVNAVTGETASPEQSGYVLGPYESTEVAGWRKDMNAIAAFEFTALSDSYAANTGRPGNVGVIGVAVFRERPVPPPPVYRDDEIALGSREEKSAADAAAPAAPSTRAGGAGTYPKSVTSTAPGRSAAQNEAARRAPSPQPEESLGTGHGARESSHASYTSFERESTRPYEVVSIWYDSSRNLQARGIIERPMPKRRHEPDPFPNGFVPDPPAH